MGVQRGARLQKTLTLGRGLALMVGVLGGGEAREKDEPAWRGWMDFTAWRVLGDTPLLPLRVRVARFVPRAPDSSHDGVQSTPQPALATFP